MSLTATDVLIRVRAETEQAVAGLGRISNALSGMAALGLTAAAAAFVHMGTEAQTQLSIVQGLAGVTASQMDSYTSSLEKMGASMGVSLDEAAKGLYYVVSAGFAGADALNVLKNTMMASEASGADLADVTHGVAGALNAYGASAQDAQKYTDIMTGAVTYGMQTYQEFAHELGMATATAAAHKVPLIELAAAEASLTEKGLPAASAFTGLAFAITKVQVPAKEMGAEVRAMGGHFNATKYAAMSFVDRLNYLHSATGISESDFIKLIGGTRSAKAALDLVSDGGKAYADVLGKLGNSSGLTAKAFEVHDKTMADGMNDVGAAVSNAAFEFVKFITPTVLPWLNNVAKGLSEVTLNAQKYGPLIGGVAVTVTILLAAAMWSLAAAVIGATWPVLLIAAAIGAVVGVLIYAYQNWTGFRIVVDTVRDALGRFFGSLGPWLSQFGSWVQSVIKWFQMIPTMVGAAFNLAGTTIHGWITSVGTWFSQLGTNIHNFLDGIAKFFMTGWALIQSIVQNAIKAVVAAFMLAYNHSYLFQAIVDFIVGAFNGVRSFIVGVWNTITGFLRAVWTALVALGVQTFTRLQTAVSTVNNAIGSTLRGVWNGIVGFLSGIWNTIRAQAQAAWNAFIAIITSAIGRAAAAAGQVNNAIANTLRGIIGTITAIGRQIIEGLIAGIRGMLGALGNIIGQVAGKIKDGLAGVLGIHSPSTVMAAMGVNLAEGLINGFVSQDVPGKVAAHLSDLGGAAVAGINVGVSGSVSSSGAAIVSATGTAADVSDSGSRNVTISTLPVAIKVDGRQIAEVVLKNVPAVARLATGRKDV